MTLIPGSRSACFRMNPDFHPVMFPPTSLGEKTALLSEIRSRTKTLLPCSMANTVCEGKKSTSKMLNSRGAERLWPCESVFELTVASVRMIAGSYEVNAYARPVKTSRDRTTPSVYCT